MVTKPPFRAVQVGSLLRPHELREARAKAKAGALTAAQLKDVEDRCIRAAVARQESLGLRAVTDGEYRRDFWHLDFMAQLEGVGMAAPVGMVFAAEDVPPMATIIGKVRCSTPIMVDHFAFLKSMAKATPKLTIPSPAMLHMRGGRNAVSRDAYPDLAEFWRDAAAGYRAAIGHIAAAGCTYLQPDDESWAYPYDAKVRDNCRATRRSCWGSSTPSRARSSRRTRCGDGSTRPRSTCRWSAWACRPSAASPARTTATR